jgi:hypothetical protein
VGISPAAVLRIIPVPPGCLREVNTLCANHNRWQNQS